MTATAAALRVVVDEATPRRWREIAGGCAGYSLLQSWEYGEAKSRSGRWAARRCLIFSGERLAGAAQVLTRELPLLRGGLAWVNRGPLSAAGAPEAGELLQALRRHWTLQRGYYLRVAPPEGAALEAPGEGFASAGRPGWASARLDLTLPLEVLRAGLRKNWRNALERAARRSAAVESGGGPLLDEFLDAYGAFLARRGFATSVTPSLLKALAEASPRREGLTAFALREDGRLSSAALVVECGDVAEYLAGFTDESAGSAGAGQLLLWSAVRAMKERGSRFFDVGGLDPELTPAGIRRFKEGLGAAPYRLPPEVEALDGRWPSRLVRWGVRRALG